MNDVTLTKRLRMNLLIKQAFISCSVYVVLTGTGPNDLKKKGMCPQRNNFEHLMTFKMHANWRKIDLDLSCPEITLLTSVFIRCTCGSHLNTSTIQIFTLCKHLLRQWEVYSVVWWNLKCQLKMMTYLMPTGHILQCLLKQNSNWLQWEVCRTENSEERKRHEERHDL